MKVKPSRLLDILTTLIPAGEPCMVTGQPGGGKTSIAEQAAAACAADCIVLHPITADTVDMKGFPFLVEVKNAKGVVTGRRADFAPYGDLEQLMNAKRRTVCVLDDFGQAAQAVQASYMHPVLAGHINGNHISEHVTFIVLTNRRQDKAAVTGIIAPFVDRMAMVMELVPDAEDWVRWAIANGVEPALCAFARLRPNYVTDYAPSKDIAKTTTPRTLEGVSRLMKLGLRDPQAIAAAAGEAFATEFCAFLSTFEAMPDVDEILMNPRKAPVPEPNRPDVLYAVMGALAYASTVDNFDAVTAYLGRVEPEFAVYCVRDAIAKTPALKSTRGYVEFTIANQAMFGLSGDK